MFKGLKKKEKERQFIFVNCANCKLNNNVNIGNCNFIISSLLMLIEFNLKKEILIGDKNISLIYFQTVQDNQLKLKKKKKNILPRKIRIFALNLKDLNFQVGNFLSFQINLLIQIILFFKIKLLNFKRKTNNMIRNWKQNFKEFIKKIKKKLKIKQMRMIYWQWQKIKLT